MARFYHPTAITADRYGNLYVTNVHLSTDNTYSAAIRKISSAGFVSTLAGQLGKSGAGDGQDLPLVLCIYPASPLIVKSLST